jgi:hypothetical protein
MNQRPPAGPFLAALAGADSSHRAVPMAHFHRHIQRVLAAVCALCIGILLARSVGL